MLGTSNRVHKWDTRKRYKDTKYMYLECSSRAALDILRPHYLTMCEHAVADVTRTVTLVLMSSMVAALDK